MSKSLHKRSKCQGNEHSKRWVLRRLHYDVAERSRYEQRRSEKLDHRRLTAVSVRRSGSDDVDADRRRDLIPRSGGWKSLSGMYIGAVPLQHLKARTASLC